MTLPEHKQSWAQRFSSCLLRMTPTAVVIFGLMMIAIFSLQLLCSGTVTPALKERNDQYGVMVWDSSCIKSLFKTEETRMEAPMVDGKPDLKSLRLINGGVELVPNGLEGCGHSEIRYKEK
jgi:hypothetical protein